MLTDPEEDYTRGWIPFLGAHICLDSRPLIPRTETEWWVEKAILEIQQSARVPEPRILDLFAGSGAIGIAALVHLKNSRVTCAEKETRHLATIKKSLKANHIPLERASIVESDVWSGVAGPFEFIFANPPYLSKERGTAHESTAHEPPEALYAPDDGFFFIAETIRGIPHFLVDGGVAWIEHEPFHRERVIALSVSLGMNAHTLPDQYDVSRFTVIRKHPPLSGMAY